MKESKYSLLDRGYFDLLQAFTEEMSSRGIQYVLVGGTGVQVTVANLLTQNGERPIDGAVGLDVLLRRTDDIDISCARDSDMESLLLQLPELNPNIRVSKIADRKAAKLSYMNGRRGESSVDVGLNYQTDPSDLKGLPAEFYDAVIQSGAPVTIKHGAKPATIIVARPEHLVASKLTRSKAKDHVDVANLLRAMQTAGKSFDYEDVKKILVEADKAHEYRFLEDVREQILH